MAHCPRFINALGPEPPEPVVESVGGVTTNNVPLVSQIKNKVFNRLNAHYPLRKNFNYNKRTRPLLAESCHWFMTAISHSGFD